MVLKTIHLNPNCVHSVFIGSPVVHHLVVELYSLGSFDWEVFIVILEMESMLSPVFFNSVCVFAKTDVASVFWLVGPCGF
jgi:hypothetical protein